MPFCCTNQKKVIMKSMSMIRLMTSLRCQTIKMNGTLSAEPGMVELDLLKCG
uniref:Uncharacterized protein n=1 Tax=Anguilla anguilla TaxID=7936 RepID=A0A0E9Y2H9_ANGAN